MHNIFGKMNNIVLIHHAENTLQNFIPLPKIDAHKDTTIYYIAPTNTFPAKQ